MYQRLSMCASKGFLLILCAALLSSCVKPSFIQNRNKEYLTAKSIPPLKIPPGVASDHFESYYPVPDRTYANKTKTVSIVPTGL